MEKKCPRCGQTFECMQENIAHCACGKRSLSAQVRVYIGDRYGNKCLCTNCLKDLQIFVSLPSFTQPSCEE